VRERDKMGPAGRGPAISERRRGLSQLQFFGLIGAVAVVLGLFLLWVWFGAIVDAGMVGPSVQPRYSSDLHMAMAIEFGLALSVPLVALGILLRHRMKRFSKLLGILGLLVLGGLTALVWLYPW
jgi:hypothetical protein